MPHQTATPAEIQQLSEQLDDIAERLAVIAESAEAAGKESVKAVGWGGAQAAAWKLFKFVGRM